MTEKPVRKYNLIKSIAEMAAVVLVVVAAKTAIAEPFYVPSGSMEPTLLIGDELLATKYPYGYGTASLPSFLAVKSSQHVFAALPKRGDVVVFRWPGDQTQVWVKRVIGLPGDRITLERGRVFINGEAGRHRAGWRGRRPKTKTARRPSARRYIETLPGGREHTIFKLSTLDPLDNIPETVVPAGHVFVMGDNRDNSADSPRAVARRWRRHVAGRQSDRPRRCAGRLLGSRHERPADLDLAEGLRLARFFTR